MHTRLSKHPLSNEDVDVLKWAWMDTWNVIWCEWQALLDDGSSRKTTGIHAATQSAYENEIYFIFERIR